MKFLDRVRPQSGKAFLIALGFFFLALCANASSHPTLSISIQPIKTVIREDESLELKVKITNPTSDDLLLSRESNHNVPGPVGIWFEVRDPNGALLPDTIGVGDCVGNQARESLASAMLKRWIVLPSKSNLTFFVSLKPSSFWTRAGEYKIRAHYQSIGLEEESWTNCISATRTELDNLPVRAFKGEIESNTSRVRILSSQVTKQK